LKLSGLLIFTRIKLVAVKFSLNSYKRTLFQQLCISHQFFYFYIANKVLNLQSWIMLIVNRLHYRTMLRYYIQVYVKTKAKLNNTQCQHNALQISLKIIIEKVYNICSDSPVSI